MVIQNIIKTIKFCKKMGISYVEFKENLNTDMTEDEDGLLQKFAKDNNCTIMIKQSTIGMMNGAIPHKYQLAIFIKLKEN